MFRTLRTGAEHAEESVRYGDDRRRRGGGQRGLVVGAAQDADDRPAPAARPDSTSLTVSPTTTTATGVPHADAGHGAEDEVGRRAPAADVRRGEGQVDLGAPIQRLEHRITGFPARTPS